MRAQINKDISSDIDWVKAEMKPESTQKIKGKDLLQLRFKVIELERQLQNKMEFIENLSIDLEVLSKKISDYEMMMEKIKEEFVKKKLLTRAEFFSIQMDF